MEMHYLALDIGKRRTGVAFAESDVGVPVSLPTLEHTTLEELAEQVSALITERKIDHVVLGLPKLPGGEEGEQATYVRSFLPTLTKLGIPYSFIDERYSTQRTPDIDPDAAAACSILAVKLDLE